MKKEGEKEGGGWKQEKAMQGWETGLVKSMHGIDDPGFLLWAGRISKHRKPGARRAAVRAGREQAAHECESQDSHLCKSLSEKQCKHRGKRHGLGVRPLMHVRDGWL